MSSYEIVTYWRTSEQGLLYWQFVRQFDGTHFSLQPFAPTSLFSLSPFCFPRPSIPLPRGLVHGTLLQWLIQPSRDRLYPVLFDLVEVTKNLLPFFCYQQLDFHFMTTRACLLRRFFIPFSLGSSYLLRLLEVFGVLCYTLSSFHQIPIVTLT